ncbi:hypothetical protein BGP76_19240 [Reichenbachiella sp. MSK19-1]|nr:hypothetical protein BGP76_19240 [Reichenbachiella sp. MSK19-1]
MDKLFEHYLKLYSFFLTTNKRTAKGTYKDYAKNLSFTNCFITIFAWSTMTLFILYYIVHLTGINIGTTILNSTFLIIGGLTSVLAINFRNKYIETINQLNQDPAKSNLDTVTLTLIQIGSGALPFIIVSILYPLILDQPLNW